ncbi:MAG: hypothetical protein FD129_2603, partial [bacterium]
GDIEIVSDFCFRLRSERDTQGDGREYTISYHVVDASGNSTMVSTVVTVPVSQSVGAMVASHIAATGSSSLLNDDTLVLQVPSHAGIEAAQGAPVNVQAGNHLGVVPAVDSDPKGTEDDVDGDLTFVFRMADVEELANRARAEALKEVLADPESADGLSPSGSLVSLYFELDGTSYLVEDILAAKRLGRTPLREIDGGQDPIIGVERDGPLVGTGTWSTLLSLAQPGLVEVVVFNVRGQKVRTLIDRELSAGRMPLAWDGLDDAGRPTPSGMYFARILVPGHQEVRKIQITR